MGPADLGWVSLLSGLLPEQKNLAKHHCRTESLPTKDLNRAWSTHPHLHCEGSCHPQVGGMKGLVQETLGWLLPRVIIFQIMHTAYANAIPKTKNTRTSLWNRLQCFQKLQPCSS